MSLVMWQKKIIRNAATGGSVPIINQKGIGQITLKFPKDKAEQFFANWKSQLRWSSLEPFKQFVKMIECHWDNIISYCNPNNKVSPGLVEGINNKVRVIQRRAYGIKDQGYLRLKILTAFLPDL